MLIYLKVNYLLNEFFNELDFYIVLFVICERKFFDLDGLLMREKYDLILKLLWNFDIIKFGIKKW